MFTYSAYDIRIASDLRLPELPCASGPADVSIRLAAPEGPVAERSIVWRDGPPPEAVFSFPGAGRFAVRGGAEIVVTPEPDAAPDLLRLYAEGMMLAAILRQRGWFVLHASVVKIGAAAIALIGPVGSGKSSLASALYAAGHGVMADDNAPLRLTPAGIEVAAAFPSLKVYPEIAASLGHDPATLRPMHVSQVKQALPLDGGFCPGVCRLARIFVLDRDATEAISDLSPMESITELIRHSAPTRWGVRSGGAHLQLCAQVARSAPMSRIRSFSELSDIPKLAARIAGHSTGAHV
jgi:hypothetical protein